MQTEMKELGQRRPHIPISKVGKNRHGQPRWGDGSFAEPALAWVKAAAQEGAEVRFCPSHRARCVSAP